MSRQLTFSAILGPGGIERDRTIEIDPSGVIAAVRPGGPPYDGFLALPGLPDAHSHAFQRALAGRGERSHGVDSFWSWREDMYRLANAVDPEGAYAVARQAYGEMLRSGFTHVVEFHYLQHGRDGARGPEMTDAVVRAAADAGLPMTLLPVYYRTSGFDGAPATAGQRRFAHASVDDFLATLEGLAGAAGGSATAATGRAPAGAAGPPATAATGPTALTLGAAPHSLRAVPPDDLPALVRGVDAILGPDAPLHVHVSEQTAEVEECRERFGRTPIELLFDRVEAGPRWHLVHATHATPSEREAVRTADASVVLCPLTEAYLGDGIFEAREHLLAGGTASVGTDSNVRISAIEELRMLEYGQRLRDRHRSRLGTAEGVGAPLWNRLAQGGARAAVAPIGRLEPGHRADLVVLDDASPTLAGHSPETAIDAWLVGGDAGDIAAVWVRGRRAVDHGVAENEAGARDAFARAMKRLWPDA